MKSNKLILITGVAGFIGYSTAKHFFEMDSQVTIIGIDNVNDYYDIALKKSRLKILQQNKNFIFIKMDISNKKDLDALFSQYEFDVVIHLAAQAGVRYSIDCPDSYINSNIIGMYNMLETIRHHSTKHFVFASSSSVYGLNKKTPFSTDDMCDSPVSLYAATKKADELLAFSYSHLYKIPTTGLRFFTVYGPMGRPDMAYYKFTNSIVKGETIKIYNNGKMLRDFTFIDDVTDAILRISSIAPDYNDDGTPFSIYNIGNSKPCSLMNFISTLEKCLFDEKLINSEAKKEFLPMQPGDVYETYADISKTKDKIGWEPHTKLEEGLSQFVKWYKQFNGGKK